MTRRTDCPPAAALPGHRGLDSALGCAVALAACTPAPPAGWSGYVEGDYVRVAAPLAGTLTALPVQPGQQVAVGAPLFALDAAAEAAAQAEAGSRAAAAQAQARNTDSGRRADELAMVEAQLAQARAQAALARSELARQRGLVERGFVSKAVLDGLHAQVAQSAARVAELEAALRVARLPARAEERRAARDNAGAAEQALRQQQWRLDQKQQRAPTAALVADTYFRVGEWVPAGAPVVALLPPGAVKARFYVGETEVGRVQPGDAVQVSCDGCGAPLTLRVSRVASQPEYTPPVIYSNAQRARLVFLVEARPDAANLAAAAARLKPGQPLDVRRAP